MSTFKLEAPWKFIKQQYQAKKFLGKGAYGQVIKAKHRETGDIVAIKMIKLVDNPHYAQSVIREISIMKQLSAMGPVNTHSVKLLKVIYPEDQEASSRVAFLVMEYIPLTLLEVLDNHSKYDLKEEHVRKILYNFVCALRFLHSAGVMHRDIKPSNILVEKDLNIKICDFGLARSTPASGDLLKPKRRLSQHVVTRYYRPPEVILMERDYDEKVDVWSTGCILAELMCSQSDYKDAPSSSRVIFKGDSCYPLSPSTDEEGSVSGADQLRTILCVLGKQDAPDLEFVTTNRKYANKMQPDLCKVDFGAEFAKNSQDLAKILSSMLQFNPNLRASVDQLIEYPYFDDVRSVKKELRAPLEVEVSLVSEYDYEMGIFSNSMGLCQQLEEVLNE